MANEKLRPTGLYFLGNSLAIYRRPVYPIVSAFVLPNYYNKKLASIAYLFTMGTQTMRR